MISENSINLPADEKQDPFPSVEIIMVGPATEGTRIIIDGVEQKQIVKAVLELNTGDVARLTLQHFATVNVKAEHMDVTRVAICPECRKEIENRPVEVGEIRGETITTTTMDDHWVRRELVCYHDENGLIS